MTRKVCTFTLALATTVSSLVALTWAQAPAGAFGQFWGPLYSHPAPDLGARRLPPADPGGQNAMHELCDEHPPSTFARACRMKLLPFSCGSTG